MFQLTLQKMCSPRNIVVAALLVLMIRSCASSRYSHQTFVDNTINSFYNEEDRFWSRIHSSTNQQSSNKTLLDIFYYFEGHLNQTGVGNIDSVHKINAQLAEYISAIKRMLQTTTRWLMDKQYQDAQQNCENIIQTIPAEITQIFDVTKRPQFLAYIRDNSDFCQTTKRVVAAGVEDLNLQNVVDEFYITVAENLVKGYMTSQMAYMVQGIKGSAKRYQSKSIELKQSFSSHYKTLQANVKSIMQNFTGEIWNCDDFSKEHSYTEITNFIQGYIDNEVNFNRDGSCRKQCSDYNQVEFHTCRNDTLCILNYLDKNKTRCDGQIRNCEFIESDMKLCPNEKDEFFTRRYDYIRYSSGLVLGKDQFCPYEVKLRSWTRWLVSCSYCFCYCDHESAHSDRYFNLRESVSNIMENNVVTGIRFLKKGRIIHIFVSERKIERFGKIEVTNSNDTYISDYNFVIEDSGVEEGKDYHKLTWHHRIIELDTIIAPPNEVVTGARFRVVNNRLRFEIRTTLYNRETGYLERDIQKSVWRGNNFHNKEQIPIESTDVPTRSPENSKRHRGENKYVEFTPTGVYKDIAQTTVPFIDTQAVEAKIPKPLKGAGVYYKSTPGYGGFIGPLIILHDD